MLGVSSTPIDTFYVVGKDGSLNLTSLGYLDLKRIALCLQRDWNDESKSDDTIICICRQHKSRSPSTLLVALHGIEVDSDYVTALWGKSLFAYHTSSPAGVPQ